MPKRTLALFAATALVIAGCGDDDDGDTTDQAASAPPATEAAAPPEPPAKPATGTTIAVGDSQYGPVVFDGDEQAIYYFDKEKTAKSECYGACAEAWPPVTTDGEPQAGKGVDEAKLGTTQRNDGTTQVTYAGRPLYYYDEPPGQVLCHNVDEFGGLWLAIQPNGDPVPV
jgi:predicted lipoprotein with Yx(FWY)xxD motif